MVNQILPWFMAFCFGVGVFAVGKYFQRKEKKETADEQAARILSFGARQSEQRATPSMPGAAGAAGLSMPESKKVAWPN